MRCRNPFFENLLYFDIAGENGSGAFVATTFFSAINQQPFVTLTRIKSRAPS